MPLIIFNFMGNNKTKSNIHVAGSCNFHICWKFYCNRKINLFNGNRLLKFKGYQYHFDVHFEDKQYFFYINDTISYNVH